MTLGITSLLSPASDHRVTSLVASARAGGIDIEFVDGGWEQRLDALRSGAAAAGWICGLLHVELQASTIWPLRAVAAPRATRSGLAGAPVYFGDVVVARDSPIREFSDLAGLSFTYNEAASLSGFRMMVARLTELGTDLGFFGSSFASGSHAESLRLVAQGAADCAVIDSTLMDDQVSGSDQVRILTSIGPYPAPPLIADPSVSQLARTAAEAAGWASLDEDVYAILRALPPGAPG